MSENQVCQSQVHVTALNRRLSAHEVGGGGGGQVITNYLVT
jgi:hypothetical protein